MPLKQRGPRRKELPECFVDIDGSYVRCDICSRFSADGLPVNILYRSAASHLNAQQHILCVAQLNEASQTSQQKKAHADAQYDNITPASLAQASNAPYVTPAPIYPVLTDSSAVDMNGVPYLEPIFDDSGNPFMFSAGEEPSALNQEVAAAQMQAELEQYGLLSHQQPDSDNDASMPHFGSGHESGDQVDIESIDMKSYLAEGSASNWAPYGNKTVFLLDLLDNFPRLRLSDSQLKIILWMMKELGCQDVPSFYALRQVQDKLCTKMGAPTVQFESSLGNMFYTNDICKSIAKDFANPLVAKHMHFYPEEGDMPVSEVWQCGRWKELPLHCLSPMFPHDNSHFYVNELAQLKNGCLVIPLMWITQNGIVHAKALQVDEAQGKLHVQSDPVYVLGSEFKYCYQDLEGSVLTPFASEFSEYASRMPNNLRKLAEGAELYSVNVNMWADDVSGNVSKQYNKHNNFYMANTAIPGRLLQQEYFVRFVSTSPFASSLEQFEAIKKQVEETHKNPMATYNAHTHRKCKFMLNISALPADNPQQSEECSHSGGNSNMLCRRCKAGGTHVQKESPEGYHSLHQCGVPRTASETKQEIETQLTAAMQGRSDAHISSLQKSTGIKDRVAQIWIDKLVQKAKTIRSQTPSVSQDQIFETLQNWLKEQTVCYYNPLLDIEGLNPHRDTPVEILHTVLLGIVKYVWHMLHTSWTDEQQATFASRLQSTDAGGLNLTGDIRAYYMMQYKNGLIGKHFKILMQTMIFHLHGLATPAQFELVKATGELASVLWYHEIKDMKQYLADLEQLIDNILDAFDECDPTRIIVKVKLHTLVHILEDIPRFGPAIRYSTEVFESFNAIFRMCSVLSNHQAPSHDIAVKFSHMDCIKHIISGGYWKEDNNSEWVQAGPAVLDFFAKNPILQRHVGWSSEPIYTKGEIVPKPRNKNPPDTLVNILSAKGLQLKNPALIDPSWYGPSWLLGKSLISETGDICKAGSWIFYRSEPTFCIGRICEIACLSSTLKGVVVINKFVLSDTLHEDFHMPIVTKQDDTETISVINAKAVYCTANVQHDCRSGNCVLHATQIERQERKDTKRTTMSIVHSDASRFLLNTHALHNAGLIREIIPRNLSVPSPLIPKDLRMLHHTQISSQLQVTQAKKRADTNEKRKATVANRKAEKAAKDCQGGGALAGPSGSGLETQSHNTDQVDVADRAFVPGIGTGMQPEAFTMQAGPSAPSDSGTSSSRPKRKQQFSGDSIIQPTGKGKRRMDEQEVEAE